MIWKCAQDRSSNVHFLLAPYTSFAFTTHHYQYNGGCFFVVVVIYLFRFSATLVKCLTFHFSSVINRNLCVLYCYIFSFDVSHEWNRFGHSHFITIPAICISHKKSEEKKDIHFYFFLFIHFKHSLWQFFFSSSSFWPAIQMAFTKTTAVAVGIVIRSLSISTETPENLTWWISINKLWLCQLFWFIYADRIIHSFWCYEKNMNCEKWKSGRRDRAMRDDRKRRQTVKVFRFVFIFMQTIVFSRTPSHPLTIGNLQ